MSPGSHALTVLLALLPLATPDAAGAQSKSALSWLRAPGAESCIGTVELGKRVERLVGPMLVPAPEGQVSVEGRIAPAARGFAAEITIADARGTILGTRQLKSENADCRAIDEPLAFVIAVAIDPNAALAQLPGELAQEEDPGSALLAELRAQRALETQPASASARTPVATPASVPASASELSAASEPAPPVQLRIALEPALGLGTLAEPDAGGVLGVGVAFGDLALWLRALAWLPQEDEVLDRDASVQLSTYGLALAVCPFALRRPPWSGTMCAGAGADWYNAEPSGFGSSQDRWVFGPDLELRAGIEPGAAWWLGVSAVVQSRWPRREIGYYDGSGQLQPVYSTPLLGGRLALVAELRF